MATQVGHIKTELLSTNTKPINPFSIENILKSEPPSPPTSPDSADEVTDDSECNPTPKTQPGPVIINPQLAWLMYQAQLQNYWRYLLVNNLAQIKGAATGKPGIPVKPVLLSGANVKSTGHKTGKSVLKVQEPSRGTKRHDVITPSTEKKIKLELEMKDQSLHSYRERPPLTQEEFELKCSRARPILHSESCVIRESTLPEKTFLEMVDINKVLDLSVTELNPIIEDTTFSDEERAYIRELRRKAMNKKAAEECRRRKKSEEQHLSEEFDLLRTTRKRLFSEKERLLEDISNLKMTVGELPPEGQDATPPSLPAKHDTELNAIEQLH